MSNLQSGVFDILCSEGNENAMCLVAERLWRMSFMLDKEIQFTGMLVDLKKNV